MHYKIKPVFVFDGNVPELKRKTIQARKFRSEDLVDKHLDRLSNYVKKKHNIDLDLKQANLKSSKLRGFSDDNLFELDDDLDFNEEESADCWEEEELVPNSKEKLREDANAILSGYKYQNFASVNTNSEEFLRLPPEVRHELLTEIKESTKFSVAERKAPEDMGDYSSYQIGKLIKSRDIQKQIEMTREEMFTQPGSSTDLKFKAQYEKYVSTRIASDDVTNLVFTKKRAQEQPKVVKPVEKPKAKNLDFNIYGSVEEFDYGISNELDPESKSGLINERLKKRLEIKKELEESSSSDDSDFIAVPDEMDDLSIDNKPFDLTEIHPVLLLNESKLIESSQPVKNGDLKFSSPNKRALETVLTPTVLTPNEPERKKISPLSSFEKTGNRSLEVTFSLTVNETIVLDDTVELSKTADDKQEKEEQKKVKEDDKLAKEEQKEEEDEQLNDGVSRLMNKSEIQSICIEDDDDLFGDETAFDAELNKFYDNLQSPTKNEEAAKPSTSKHGLSIDFLESPDDELSGLVDKQLIEMITESPVKFKQSSDSDSQSNEQKKELKIVQLKPPTDDQLASNKVKKASDAKVDLSETIRLMRDVKKVKRQTNTVGDSVVEETKKMLGLFGIPFVVSPMEAEAQCAILEQLDLVAGTITDDSDVWLFGAKTVYKNFYNQSKFVMKYTASEIESNLKLSRDNLICLAMLTGSDYSDGIKGIGPVTATEIISEFNGEQLQPLIEFKRWLTDNKNGKPRKHNGVRNKFLKYDLPKSFPSQQVYDAYQNPEADRSEERFQFGKPDLDLLRKYTREKFQWSKERQDQELLPLFKRINDATTQTKIQDYFRVVAKQKDSEPGSVGSKRLQKALDNKRPVSDGNRSSEAQSKLNGNATTSSKAAAAKPSKAKKETKKAAAKKADKKPANEKDANTFKSKVKNQRKKKESASKVPSIFDKQIGISKFFIKQSRPASDDSKTKTDADGVICLSEDSD